MNPLNWSPHNTFKWIALALVIRAIIFVFFTLEFQQNWLPEYVHYGFVIDHNDTFGYYIPLDMMADGQGYASICRMPGLVPIYYPIRLLMAAEPAKAVVVILQFLASCVAVWALARAAFLWTGSAKLFRLVFILTAISSFISIWDHAAISDSFSISFLIFSIWGIAKFSSTQSLKYALISGAFLTWSIFFRPAHILVYPAMAFILWASYGIKWNTLPKTILASLILVSSFLVADVFWIKNNFEKKGEFIWLQAEDDDCFGSLPEYHVAVRDMIIQRGGDYQEWSPNTELAWIIDGDSTSSFPFDDHFFTTNYPLDSLREMKKMYNRIYDSTQTKESIENAKQTTTRLAKAMALEYKQERPGDYYLFNRLKLIRMFILSGHLDNLPLPSRDKMNKLELGIKAFYLFFLHAIVVLFLIATLRLIFARNWLMLGLALAPWTIILIIGGVLGYAEQRYLTPAYPFMVVVIGYFLLYFKKGNHVNIH